MLKKMIFFAFFVMIGFGNGEITANTLPNFEILENFEWAFNYNIDIDKIRSKYHPILLSRTSYQNDLSAKTKYHDIPIQLITMAAYIKSPENKNLFLYLRNASGTNLTNEIVPVDEKNLTNFTKTVGYDKILFRVYLYGLSTMDRRIDVSVSDGVPEPEPVGTKIKIRGSFNDLTFEVVWPKKKIIVERKKWIVDPKDPSLYALALKCKIASAKKPKKKKPQKTISKLVTITHSDGIIGLEQAYISKKNNELEEIESNRLTGTSGDKDSFMLTLEDPALKNQRVAVNLYLKKQSSGTKMFCLTLKPGETIPLDGKECSSQKTLDSKSLHISFEDSKTKKNIPFNEIKLSNLKIDGNLKEFVFESPGNLVLKRKEIFKTGQLVTFDLHIKGYQPQKQAECMVNDIYNCEIPVIKLKMPTVKITVKDARKRKKRGIRLYLKKDEEKTEIPLGITDAQGTLLCQLPSKGTIFTKIDSYGKAKQEYDPSSSMKTIELTLPPLKQDIWFKVIDDKKTVIRNVRIRIGQHIKSKYNKDGYQVIENIDIYLGDIFKYNIISDDYKTKDGSKLSFECVGKFEGCNGLSKSNPIIVRVIPNFAGITAGIELFCKINGKKEDVIDIEEGIEANAKAWCSSHNLDIKFNPLIYNEQKKIFIASLKCPKGDKFHMKINSSKFKEYKGEVKSDKIEMKLKKPVLSFIIHPSERFLLMYPISERAEYFDELKTKAYLKVYDLDAGETWKNKWYKTYFYTWKTGHPPELLSNKGIFSTNWRSKKEEILDRITIANSAKSYNELVDEAIHFFQGFSLSNDLVIKGITVFVIGSPAMPVRQKDLDNFQVKLEKEKIAVLIAQFGTAVGKTKNYTEDKKYKNLKLIEFDTKNESELFLFGKSFDVIEDELKKFILSK